MQPLLVLNETIEGLPTQVEIRQEVADNNEVISHVSLVQDGKEDRLFDMRFTVCSDESHGEPHWKFVTEVPAELKEIEWTISEAILEKDM